MIKSLIDFAKPWDKVFFRIDNIIYTWQGWFGCQLVSYERKRPDFLSTRMIAGNEMHIFDIRRKGLFKFEVCWTVRNADNEKIFKLKRDLAGLI